MRWIEGYRSATAVLRSLLSSAGFCSCRAHRVRLPWSRTYRMSPAPPQAARYPPSNPSPRFTRRGIFSVPTVAQKPDGDEPFLVSALLSRFENPSPGIPSESRTHTRPYGGVLDRRACLCPPVPRPFPVPIGRSETSTNTQTQTPGRNHSGPLEGGLRSTSPAANRPRHSTSPRHAASSPAQPVRTSPVASSTTANG